MSGFDFGSLRDPDAPIPGARQREGVEMRARELATRARRGRMLAAALVLVIVGGVVGAVGVVAATRDNNPRISVTNHGTSTTIAPTSSTKPGVVATSTSTTTTTTPPASPPSHAVSASFVSANDGWMHEANGDVLRTTDGGATWHAVGSLGAAGSDAKMRFADSSRGFAYNTRGLFGTTDGGAHWKKLQTPFSVVADLEISRGVVYAVTWPPDNAAGGFAFRIWSARANDLVWSRDPLTLQVGAGPIPSEQIVFAGGQGWILNEDRTVISGTRLPGTGPWVSWNPPCLDTNGAAQLAASSGADLVASCHEHEWGGGPIASAVYFSHDGGQTFQRRTAPAFGDVASPNPTTAVVNENGVLRRTTDEGASWGEVAREPNAHHARDLGFTTATQGFVIFDTGKMLMTYDAGATWSAVTLP